MSSGEGPAIAVTFITAPACHLCDHGRRVLDELADTHPLEVRELDMTAPEGAAAMARTRAPFPPVVVVEGRPIAHGRLSRRRLARELDRLAVTKTGG